MSVVNHGIKQITKRFRDLFVISNVVARVVKNIS